MSVKPAMSAEEWQFVRLNPSSANDDEHVRKDHHKRAAYHLYGQPFGFTRDDVRLWQFMAEHALQCGELPTNLMDACDDMAERIAALLPPEPQT